MEHIYQFEVMLVTKRQLTRKEIEEWEHALTSYIRSFKHTLPHQVVDQTANLTHYEHTED